MGTQLMGAFAEVFTPIGEPELDEELAISGDDPSGLRGWLSRLEIRQPVRQLTLEHHAKLSTVTAQLSIPSLQCSYSPYHWYYRPHLPAVLEIMSPLAASLENRAEPVRSGVMTTMTVDKSPSRKFQCLHQAVQTETYVNACLRQLTSFGINCWCDAD